MCSMYDDVTWYVSAYHLQRVTNLQVRDVARSLHHGTCAEQREIGVY